MRSVGPASHGEATEFHSVRPTRLTDSHASWFATVGRTSEETSVELGSGLEIHVSAEDPVFEPVAVTTGGRVGYYYPRFYLRAVRFTHVPSPEMDAVVGVAASVRPGAGESCNSPYNQPLRCLTGFRCEEPDRTCVPILGSEDVAISTGYHNTLLHEPDGDGFLLVKRSPDTNYDAFGFYPRPVVSPLFPVGSHVGYIVNWNSQLVVRRSMVFSFDPFVATHLPCYIGIDCETDETMRYPNIGRRNCRRYERFAHACTAPRLPTEDEWEYLARADTHTQTWAGDLPTMADPCELIPWLRNVGRYCDDAPYPAYWSESDPMNPWGLYGVLGAVAQWTETVLDDTLDADGNRLPDGTALRVIRGGHATEDSTALDLGRRQIRRDDVGYPDVGARFVQRVPRQYEWTGRIYTNPDGTLRLVGDLAAEP